MPRTYGPAKQVDTITSAEIVAAVPGGRTLVYTDSPARRIGFVDISRPHAPRPGGALPMDGEPRIELAGQPDSVAISPDRRYAAIVIENEATRRSPTA